MHEQLVADPDIVSPLQILLLRLIAEAEREYGFVGLRLEGGTALSGRDRRHHDHPGLERIERVSNRTAKSASRLNSAAPYNTHA